MPRPPFADAKRGGASHAPLDTRLRGYDGVLGLFEESGDFVEEGWEFLLDDFPDFLVSDFGVSVDEDNTEADDVSVVGYLGSDVWVVSFESGHGFADDDE